MGDVDYFPRSKPKSKNSSHVITQFRYAQCTALPTHAKNHKLGHGNMVWEYFARPRRTRHHEHKHYKRTRIHVAINSILNCNTSESLKKDFKAHTCWVHLFATVPMFFFLRPDFSETGVINRFIKRSKLQLCIRAGSLRSAASCFKPQ